MPPASRPSAPRWIPPGAGSGTARPATPATLAALAAQVRLHDRPVGELRSGPDGSCFHYTDDLLAADHQVLGQVFEEGPGTARRAAADLPAWFANLLPEGAQRRYAERGVAGGRLPDFPLLVRLGRDLPGAVSVVPEPDLPVRDPVPHCLPGGQLKFTVSADRLAVADSGGHPWWIVKLADSALPAQAANEYLTMNWLRLAGLDVPTVLITPAHALPDLADGLAGPDEEVLLVPRFDRIPGGRVHVEDFAQIADVPPGLRYRDSGTTYDSLGEAIMELVGPDGLLGYLQRLVAMVVVGDTDAHLKSWALIYPDGRHPVLAPAYGVHSDTVYQRSGDGPLALALAGEQLAGRVTRDHLHALGKRGGLARHSVDAVLNDTLAALREAWPAVADEAQARFPALARHVGARLAQLPICRADPLRQPIRPRHQKPPDHAGTR